MTKHLILVGLMGSGKSTVARLLRRKMYVPIYEIDGVIERSAGKSIPEIFAQDGEQTFRELEQSTVTDLIKMPPGIVSTGGGTFVGEQNRKVLLGCGWVFYLSGTPKELAQRIQSTANRPLLRDRDKIEVLSELWTARDPFYRQAHFVVGTDHRTSHDVAEEIAHLFLKIDDSDG